MVPAALMHVDDKRPALIEGMHPMQSLAQAS